MTADDLERLAPERIVVLGGPSAVSDGLRPNTIPAATSVELTRLDPGRIVVLGGRSAVSDNNVTALGEFTTGTVALLSGPDRFATSLAISQAGFEPGVEAVFLATGAQFADALAAGAASHGNVPILLTRQDCVPQVVLDEINRLDPGEIRVLGGPAAVGPGAYALTACGAVP